LATFRLGLVDNYSVLQISKNDLKNSTCKAGYRRASFLRQLFMRQVLFRKCTCVYATNFIWQVFIWQVLFTGVNVSTSLLWQFISGQQCNSTADNASGGQSHQLQQLGNLLSLCIEFAGARDILQKLKKFKKTTRVKFQLLILHF
jgi:hypothetical protein